jgi:hypothetical protein
MQREACVPRKSSPGWTPQDYLTKGQIRALSYLATILVAVVMIAIAWDHIPESLWQQANALFNSPPHRNQGLVDPVPAPQTHPTAQARGTSQYINGETNNNARYCLSAQNADTTLRLDHLYFRDTYTNGNPTYNNAIVEQDARHICVVASCAHGPGWNCSSTSVIEATEIPN